MGGIGTVIGGIARPIAVERAQFLQHDDVPRAIDQPPPFGPRDFLWNFLWLPLLTAVLCYLLAIHLASPLRQLRLAVERFGGLDGFHANFGCFRDGGSGEGCDILELPLEDYDEVMRVNARGFLLCTRAAIPAMIARGGGSIVYTSSSAAYDGGRQRVAYAVSKTAILALMRHVATRHGPDGIRANAIAPGYIAWPNRPDIYTPEIVEGAKAGQRIKARIGEPNDIASMGALLMSDDGAFITGQTIAVDGGLTMRA